MSCTKTGQRTCAAAAAAQHYMSVARKDNPLLRYTDTAGQVTETSTVSKQHQCMPLQQSLGLDSLRRQRRWLMFPDAVSRAQTARTAAGQWTLAAADHR